LQVSQPLDANTVINHPPTAKSKHLQLAPDQETLRCHWRAKRRGLEWLLPELVIDPEVHSMLAVLARKTFDLYTAPARFAYRQTRRNIAALQKMRGDFSQWQSETDAVVDQLLNQAGQRMGVDPAGMTQEERRRHARNALANVEYGLSLALREALKALILLSADDRKSPRPGDSGQVIDGECQRIG
jgi:phage FluMu protein gp41